MKRILVVTVNWLGDALMTTPVFRAIKDKIPSAYLGVMAPGRIKEVFEDNPCIDEVIVFDEKREQKSLLAKLKFIKSLKKKEFDTVFLIHRSFTKALICRLAGIKMRIGYRRLKNFLVLTDVVSPKSLPIHRQDHYLSLFEAQGIEISKKNPDFFIPPAVQDELNLRLAPLKQNHSFIAGINPSANWAPKRWPAGNFSRLADFLIKEYKAAVVFIGTEKEKKVIREVISKMQGKAYDFSGTTSLKQLGALIANSRIFISNDSGPAHLAAALKVLTIVLFGPTAKEFTGPRGEKVVVIQKDSVCPIPCYQVNCRDNRCMSSISVEEVIAVIKKRIDHV